MKPVLMIFIDGVGIGKKDNVKNPFFKFGFNTFTKIFGSIPHLENQFLDRMGNYLFPVDARMGIEGLPQSGTGQVSIFCGVNAPKIVGKHFGPFPYSSTVPIIKDKNIFKTFLNLKKRVKFANAYPKVFFDYLKSGRTRLSTTSLSCTLSGVKLNTVTDVRKREALTAEITNERWNKKLNYNLPIIKASTAAKRLLKIAAKNDFTLYEFFLTDHLGHGRISDEIESIYHNLDEFLFTIISEMNSKEMTLLICSDHGNFEDLSVKTHTLNPALCITSGVNAYKLKRSIKDLSQIKGALLKYCI